MIDKNDFKHMRKDIEEFDLKREELIKKSRDIVRFSKQVIYSVHRNELSKAGTHVKNLKKDYENLLAFAKKTPELLYCGNFRVCAQEYVEAVCFFEYVKNKKIPKHTELGVFTEHYLLGLCDLTGELVRKAVNSVIKKNYQDALEIKDFVDEVYYELMLMDFRNSELRRKFDGIKYDLKKLGDLALEITK